MYFCWLVKLYIGIGTDLIDLFFFIFSLCFSFFSFIIFVRVPTLKYHVHMTTGHRQTSRQFLFFTLLSTQTQHVQLHSINESKYFGFCLVAPFLMGQLQFSFHFRLYRIPTLCCEFQIRLLYDCYTHHVHISVSNALQFLFAHFTISVY